MDSFSCKVKFTPLRSNLVNLPESVTSVLNSINVNVQQIVLEITRKTSSNTQNQTDVMYAGWTGLTSKLNMDKTIQVLEIDPIFAAQYTLLNNDNVIVQVKFNIDECSRIWLEPISYQDWELVESHAKYLEDRLLNQTRVVKLSQILVVYPNSTTSAILRVKKIEGTDTSELIARLSNNCEVIIAPKTRNETHVSSSRDESGKSDHEQMGEKREQLIFRNICLPNKIFGENIDSRTTMEVYVNFDLLPCEFKKRMVKIDNEFYIRATTLQSCIADKPTINNGAKSKLATKTSKETWRISKIKESSNSIGGYCGISYCLAYNLNVVNSNGNFLILENLPMSPEIDMSFKKISIIPYTDGLSGKTIKFGNDKQDKFDELQMKQIKEIRNYLYNNYIGSEFKIPPIVGDFASESSILPFGGIIRLKVASPLVKIDPSCKLDLEKKTITCKQSLIKAWKGEFIEDLGILNVKNNDDDFVAYEDLQKQIINVLEEGSNRSGGVLLSGQCGTSRFIRSIIRTIFRETTFKINRIDFKEQLQEIGNFEKMKRLLAEKFSKMMIYENNLLILEHLDLVCLKEAEDGSIGSEKNSTSNQISEFLITHINDYKCKLLITANNKNEMNKLIVSNPLLIDKFFNIKKPNKSQRMQILNYFLLLQNLPKLNNDNYNLTELSDMINATEGFLASDLKIIVEKAYYESYFDENNVDETLSMKHFQIALSDYIPQGLRNIKSSNSNHSGGSSKDSQKIIKWDDIGGLTSTKQLLLETLQWPVKYAPIFENCPLRLRSGILLYGYPGCGKTMIASSIAKQFGMNFITVKGPELLSKYIGASEQKVRELFDNANAARPCILFFDEFDSIAPKRGHDSTGVTDRVVNQMLTQMDGAEGLAQGVYILAATSRPDLIDSALLRPGRLDKSVLCGLPGFADRCDIIGKILKKMCIDDGNEGIIEYLANETERYSGADLQALCYNAYLNAVHRVLDNESSRGSKTIKGKLHNQYKSDLKILQVDSLDNHKILCMSSNEKKEIIERLDKMKERLDNENFSNLGKVNDTDDKNSGKIINRVNIRREDFEYAVRETKASISDKEYNKLNRVYREFVSDRDGNMPSGEASTHVGGRVTLM